MHPDNEATLKNIFERVTCDDLKVQCDEILSGEYSVMDWDWADGDELLCEACSNNDIDDNPKGSTLRLSATTVTASQLLAALQSVSITTKSNQKRTVTVSSIAKNQIYDHKASTTYTLTTTDAISSSQAKEICNLADFNTTDYETLINSFIPSNNFDTTWLLVNGSVTSYPGALKSTANSILCSELIPVSNSPLISVVHPGPGSDPCKGISSLTCDSDPACSWSAIQSECLPVINFRAIVVGSTVGWMLFVLLSVAIFISRRRGLREDKAYGEMADNDNDAELSDAISEAMQA
eukprot:TRINITY_DN28947_c0_g1_i1.p1 TRINITY_DN28947_c0_g1~~TRINITY_DN28947_c0_g1_i1.p1  ORF type:complete len:309 (+),score=48.59 TRINITY_DN28947_c0_g1_i1:51-929(+)